MGLPPIPENNDVDPITGAPISGGKGKAPRQSRRKGGGLGRGAGIIAALAVGGAAVAGVVVLNSTTSAGTVDVYQLTKDVAANQLITKDDITVVRVQEGLEPENPITEADLASSRWFATVSLPAGTVLQDGVVSTALRTVEELEAGMSLISLSVEPENAVAGRVQAGSYVNLYAVNDGVATLVMSKLNILNVQPEIGSVASSGGRIDPSSKPGPDSPKLYGGIPSLYTFAVKSDEAARLSVLNNSGFTFYMTLTSIDAEPAAPIVITQEEALYGDDTSVKIGPDGTEERLVDDQTGDAAAN